MTNSLAEAVVSPLGGGMVVVVVVDVPWVGEKTLVLRSLVSRTCEQIWWAELSIAGDEGQGGKVRKTFYIRELTYSGPLLDIMEYERYKEAWDVIGKGREHTHADIYVARTPMGVNAIGNFRSRRWRPPSQVCSRLTLRHARPPIDMSGSFPVHVSAKSPSNISPNC